MQLFKSVILLFLLVAVIYLTRSTAALFADQAGLNDWTKQHVGEVSHAVLAGDRVFVATKQGVVASLLVANGEIEWRRVYPKTELEITKLIFQANVLVTKGKNSVKAWNLDGQMLWEQASENTILDAVFADDETVAVLTKEKLLTFNALSGAALSKSSRDLSTIQTANLKLVVVDGITRVAHVEKADSKFKVVVSSSKDDQGQQFASSVDDFAVAQNGCMVMLASTESVSIECLGTGKQTTIAVPGGASSIKASPDGSFVSIEGASTRTIIYGFRKGAEPSHATIPLACVTVDEKGRLFEFKAANSLKIRNGRDQPFELSLPHELAVVQAWSSGDRLLTTAADASIRLFQLEQKSLKILWSREEALADIMQIVSAAFPHKSDNKVGVSRFTSQVARLTEAVNSFASATMLMVQGISEAIMRVAKGGDFDLKSISETSEEERARFGFNRILVFLTKKNKLFAIHSETGVLLWAKNLDGFVRPTIFVVQDDPEPQVLALDSISGKTLLLEAIDGRSMASETSITNGKSVLQALTVDAGEHGRKRTLVVLDVDLNIKLYPVKQHIDQPLYMNVLDKAKFEFTGYRISPGASKATVAWNQVFPADHKFVEFAAPSANDPISSPVRPLGDGSLLVKHISPSLVGLITSDASQGLRIHLIDTVSGRIINRSSHKDGAEPVHAVRFENWLVYSFWNSKARRFELVSMTLYEKAPITRRQLNPWTSVPKILQTNFSSFDVPEITVLQRSFFLPGQEITALGVTTTLRGIASKNLLVSLGGTGQILMLDQRLIDPRRTSQAPTEEEKLEGLFQYSPELPLVPTHILSYYRGAGERGADLFYVAPSLLESTCTIIAAGLDIFKGRASPSGAFDLLAEDFNYMLLFLLITTLAVCVYVLRRMERRKSLEAAWA